MSKWINENEIIKYCKGNKVLISHGGVSSEYLTNLLQIKYPSIILSSNKPLKGSIVHYPYPPPELSQVIYVYGDIYNAILSQLERHPDNPSKLCNNLDYYHFHNLKELCECPNEDPFNLEKQIFRFMNDQTEYPIIILKYGFHKSLLSVLAESTGNQNFMKYQFKTRKERFKVLENYQKENLMTLYSRLNHIVKQSPDLIIRYPSSISYQLSQKDVLKYKVKNKFPGKRMKHYRLIGGYEIYNERDCSYKPGTCKYGVLRIRKIGEPYFKIYDFQEKGLNITSKDGGVEDPRYFKLNDSIYVLVNSLEPDQRREMYLYNLERDHLVKLWIKEYDLSGIKRQKNWTPYVYFKELYLIYSFDPLCVLKVTDLEKGECQCLKGNPLEFNNDFDVFGSTPLIQWNYPNFIGFAHSRLPHYSCPIIFDVEKLEIKYIGKPIIFKNPKGITPWRGKIVQFPYDLTIKGNNVILRVEFEDKCPTLVYLDYIGFCKAFSF